MLRENGLPDNIDEENIDVGDHGNVEISGLDNKICLEIIKKTHYPDCRKQFLNKPIYCRAVIDLKNPSEGGKKESNPNPGDTDGAKSLLQLPNKLVPKPLKNTIAISDDEQGDDEFESSYENKGDNMDNFDWTGIDNNTENLVLNRIKSKLFRDSGEESSASELDTKQMSTPPNQFLKQKKKRKKSDQSSSKKSGKGKKKKQKQLAE